MTMHAIRRSFLRAARRQARTAELGHPILRLILGGALALDFMAGHPLWPTVAIVVAIAAVFVRGAREIRRAATPSPGAEGPRGGE
jgi:hypothetical protein